jgi:hypothetical protein
MTAEPTSGRHALLPHPTSADGAVRDLTVDVARPSAAQLKLDYRLAGDIAQLRLPEPRPAVRSDGLWRHSCFEAFIGRAPGPEYWEYNFSPSGAWAAYHFSAYREGMSPLLKGAPPAMSCRVDDGSFEMSVLIDLAWLTRSAAGGLTLGLCAVVESKLRVLSWWALAHPSEKPDFHTVESRVVSLD